MSEKTTHTILDKALSISNKVLDSILFENMELENCLYGFLAASIMLGRETDTKWVKGELEGFVEDETPDYRKKVKCFVFHKKTQVFTKNSSFFQIPVVSGLPKLVHEMKKNDKDRITFSIEKGEVNDLTYEFIKKNADEKITADFVNIEYFKSDLSKLFGSVKVELIERLNSMIQEISYGKVPYGIFQKFQDKVNVLLAESNTKAVSELNIAIESLGHSNDPERISHVAHACKRLIKAVSDQVFPPKKEEYIMKDGTSRKVEDEQYLNRLEAFVDSINHENRKFILKKIKLLRDLYGETNESLNRGTHNIISNQAAEMAVIYSYLILGEIILEKEEMGLFDQGQKAEQSKLK